MSFRRLRDQIQPGERESYIMVGFGRGDSGAQGKACGGLFLWVTGLKLNVRVTVG
jgi:hypothetical protein